VYAATHFPKVDFAELEQWLQDNDEAGTLVWFGEMDEHLRMPKPTMRFCLDTLGQSPKEKVRETV
jgi:hypothetical protein